MKKPHCIFAIIAAVVIVYATALLSVYYYGSKIKPPTVEIELPDIHIKGE